MTKRLRRAMKLATAIGLIAALMVPGQAAGAKKKAPRDRCGGKWDAAASCKFRYTGEGVSIWGGYTAEQAGYVSISLEAIEPTTGARVPVITCGIAGGKFGGCATASTSSPTIELERGQKLFCVVQGADRGTYKCANA